MFWRLPQNELVSLVRSPVFSVPLNAHLLPSLQFTSYQRNTQVDARNHKHSLCDKHCFSTPKKSRSMLTGFPFLNNVSLSGSFFPTNSVVERAGRSRILTFSLGVLAYSLDRVSFHTYLLERIDLLLSSARNFHCLFFPLPLDLQVAAAAPEAGF